MFHSFGRTFKTAAWLGWQIESNWADPLVFFIFSILKPVSSAMILVFMYKVVSQVGAGDPIFAYIYLGNAFYLYVGAVIAGTSFSILDDRERYRTLKYMYIAPINIPVYLMGRAVARFIIGTIAVLATMLMGICFFGLPINLLAVNWPLFFVAFVLGLLSMVGMGIILGSWSLTIRSEPWFLGEATAAALYLFSGAIFPLDILPRWLRIIGYLLPITYWLELIRRALLGTHSSAFPTFAQWSNLQLLGMLALMTLIFGLLAKFAFSFFDRLARNRSMIDTVSNF